MNKRYLFITICLLAIFSLIAYNQYMAFQKHQEQIRLIEEARIKAEKEKIEQAYIQKRLKDHALKALRYAKEHNLDEKHVILIDFSIHSGKKRFFVWNTQTAQVELESIVAHGYGNEQFRSSQTDIIFSNTIGSYASSLGKYTIGQRSYSQYGINIHYKLHGLEKSNSNAYKRVVVLHSYKDIPTTELYPAHLPLGFSQGCPVIDDETMLKIDVLLKKKHKPTLLWIYA